MKKNNLTLFKNNEHLINLKEIISKEFSNFNVEILTQNNINNFIKEKNLDFYNHLEDDERIIWFKEKTKSDNYSIFVLIYNENEIIATISFSQYITLYYDVYEKMLNLLNISVYDTINKNTMIVNKNFRNNGMCSKLINITNKYWFNYYDFIIASTVSLDALKLYKKLGAIECYQENFDDENYYYFYYKK